MNSERETLITWRANNQVIDDSIELRSQIQMEVNRFQYSREGWRWKFITENVKLTSPRTHVLPGPFLLRKSCQGLESNLFSTSRNRLSFSWIVQKKQMFFSLLAYFERCIYNRSSWPCTSLYAAFKYARCEVV